GNTLKVQTRKLPSGIRVLVASDITEITNNERRRRELEEQLHHSQKLEALGTLAGGMAHDLNNTLVPLLALAKSMAARFPAESRERVSLDLISQASERARELVRQILAFSRKGASERKAFDLAAVVDESLKMLRALVPTSIDIVPQLSPVPQI